ncbi:MAG: ydfK [Frankiales bacterium]|nr:ydfK [Frankiales bacterium]
MVRGTGTLLNVATVLAGSGLGVLLGGRLPERTRATVTDALGLVTLVIGGLNVAALSDPAYERAVTGGGTLLVVLGALLVGGVAGSLLRVEERLERSGAWLQRRLSGGRESRFVEGFVTASLVFCVGPLTLLGSLSDGLGRGIEQLALKSTLDGFASLAFAASLGWGVAASALSVLVVQGSLTVLGALLGALLPPAELAAVTATGGVLLLGVGLRLLDVKAVPVADLLPALLVAPLLVTLVEPLL